MTPETLKILNDADDPVEWEAPADFNWRESLIRVISLKPQIERIIGHSLILNDHIQDASYFAELCLLHPVETEDVFSKSLKSPLPATSSCLPDSVELKGSPKILLNVCFSNFGNLFTIWSDCTTEEFSPDLLVQARKTIESQGFKFVDSGELQELYTGANEAIRNAVYSGEDKYTWAIRFFSYL